MVVGRPAPAIVAAILVVTAGLLVLLHALANTTDLDGLRTTFGLGYEDSVPTWYSSIQFLALACLLGLLGAANRRHRPRVARTAWIGSIVAVYFSLDEAATIHESITGLLGRFDSVPTFEGGHGIWIFVYAIIGILLLIVAAPGAIEIARLHTREAVAFAFGAVVFVGGGVGVEILSYGGAELTWVEEGMEILGVATMVAASYYLTASAAITFTPWPAPKSAIAAETKPTSPGGLDPSPD